MEKAPARHGQDRRRPEGSPLFEEFYRAQGIVPEAEWPAFLAALKTSLPACFRVTAGRYADREGGYTRVLRTMPRAGDNAPMGILELV